MGRPFAFAAAAAVLALAGNAAAQLASTPISEINGGVMTIWVENCDVVCATQGLGAGTTPTGNVASPTYVSGSYASGVTVVSVPTSLTASGAGAYLSSINSEVASPSGIALDQKGAGVAAAAAISPAAGNGLGDVFSSLSSEIASIITSALGSIPTGAAAGTSTIVTTTSVTTSVTASAIPAGTPYVVTVAAPLARRARRQAAGSYVDATGFVTSDCASGASFTSSEGELLSDGKVVSTDADADSAALVGSSTVMAISTTFELSNGALVWANSAFATGFAQWCELTTGQIVAIFNGDVPTGCTIVTLGLTPASSCPASSSSSITPIVTSSYVPVTSTLVSSGLNGTSSTVITSSSLVTSTIIPTTTSSSSPISVFSSVSSTPTSTLASSSSTLASSSSTTSTSSLPTYSLVWSDEFDGDSLNQDYWSYQNGDGCNISLCGWGNGEIETYATSQVSVADGNLVITASLIDGTWYSGKLISQNKVYNTYGRVEARILLPTGDGPFPAFWMLPNSDITWPYGGEIDITEYESAWAPDVSPATVHYEGADGAAETSIASGTVYVSDAYADGNYHIYGIVWTEEGITFTRDEIAIGTYANDGTNIYPFTDDFFLILNLAIQPSWGSQVPADATDFQMLVDYVRWYTD